jgi:hypothetical protein
VWNPLRGGPCHSPRGESVRPPPYRRPFTLWRRRYARRVRSAGDRAISLAAVLQMRRAARIPLDRAWRPEGVGSIAPNWLSGPAHIGTPTDRRGSITATGQDPRPHLPLPHASLAAGGERNSSCARTRALGSSACCFSCAAALRWHKIIRPRDRQRCRAKLQLITFCLF